MRSDVDKQRTPLSSISNIFLNEIKIDWTTVFPLVALKK